MTASSGGCSAVAASQSTENGIILYVSLLANNSLVPRPPVPCALHKIARLHYIICTEWEGMGKFEGEYFTSRCE